MKIATIGTSMIAEQFLAAVKLNDGVECVAAYSRREETGRAFTERNNIPKLYTSMEDMLADPEIEFVYVGTPNSLHYSQTMQVLEAGRHVICEKAFMVNAQQAEDVAALAKEKGLYVFEAITTIHSPNYKLLREKIKEIGKISMVQCQYLQYSRRYDLLKAGEMPNIFNPQYAAGALMDINIYNIHFAVRLLGSPERTEYFPVKHTNGIDLGGTVVMQYPDMVCTCAGSKIADGDNQVQIHGDQGYIYVAGGPNGKKNFTIVTEEGMQKFDVEEDTERLYHEVHDFAEIYHSGGLEECHGLLDYSVAVMRVLDAARASAGIVFPDDEKQCENHNNV